MAAPTGALALQVLILAPTHEIALQSAEVLSQLAVHAPEPGIAIGTFIGGLPIAEDQKLLRRYALIPPSALEASFIMDIMIAQQAAPSVIAGARCRRFPCLQALSDCGGHSGADKQAAGDGCAGGAQLPHPGAGRGGPPHVRQLREGHQASYCHRVLSAEFTIEATQGT